MHYPLDALAQVLRRLAVIAKRDTRLPPVAGRADVWVEPDEPRHPLCGIVHALRLAGGRPVLCVAGDLPLIDAPTLRVLLAHDASGEALAVVPRADGRLQPLCALYRPAALGALEGFDPGARTVEVVEALGPAVLEVADGRPFHNVNAPEDLLLASALLPRTPRAERSQAS